MIMDKSALLLIPACLVGFGGCSKRGNPEVSPSSSISPSAIVTSEQPVQQIDACSLLTSEEIQSVQGEAVTGTTPSGGMLNGFPSAQCVFTTVTPVNSVSVVITQSAANSPRRIRDFW